MAKLIRISLIPFALLCVLILRLLKGRIRLGRLWTDRIGHLAGNVDVHLCERNARLRPRNIEIWSAGNPCNKQLLKMWSRVMHIDRTGFTEIVHKVNRLFRGWEKIEIHSGNLDRDVHNLLEQSEPHLYFTAKEEARGEAELRRMGIPEDAAWVCLIVRDSAYLPELGYHSYRDSDIETYLQAVRVLADRGYYVIRMGAKVAKPMPSSSKRIIDYATNGMRSDFMDIYLAAKCEFAISTSTGLDAVCTAFRRPICYVNFVPLEYLPTWHKGLAIWKHHEKDGKRMTPKEIYESGAGQFMRADQYEEAGITLVDNTPDEIKAVVMEMADTYNGSDKLWPIEDWDRIYKFWQYFPRSISPYTQAPLHGEIRLRIGREFLISYIGKWVPRESLTDISEKESEILDNLMCYYG